MSAPQDLRQRRRERLRFQLRKKSAGRPRLSVFRSGKHIYAQVIDDARGHTLAAASDIDPDVIGDAKGKAKTACAELVGVAIARKAAAAGVERVVFDRGGFLYHGRVKALAEAARKAGLSF